MRIGFVLRTLTQTSTLLLSLSMTAGFASADSEVEGERALRVDDFAFGRTLEIGGDDALQSVLLDGEVYRGTVEPELADLRVFNGEGEAVPHAIRRLKSRHADEELSDPLPLFRLRDASRDDVTSSDGYRIEASVVGGAAKFRMEPVLPGAVSESDGEIVGYLVDTDALDKQVVGLELELAPDTRDFIARLRVEGSEDLLRYHARSNGSAIALLEQAGHRVVQTRIHLSRNEDRYLKLDWRNADFPAAIQSIRAYTAPDRMPVPELREKLAAEPLDLAPGVHVYDLGSELPVRHVQVEFARSNSLVEARLESSLSLDGPWRQRHSGLFYDLDFGGRLRNEPVRFGSGATTPRYMRLVVAEKGGGREGGAPHLEVVWQPEQLIFVAGGAAPFTLAYGRSQVQPTRFDFGKLLAVTQTRERELPLETATLGSHRLLAGPSALEPRREPVPPRTLVLWGVLAMAVAGVAWMSLSLLREMKSAESDRTVDG